jgi:hypothetical protein
MVVMGENSQREDAGAERYLEESNGATEEV